MEVEAKVNEMFREIALHLVKHIPQTPERDVLIPEILSTYCAVTQVSRQRGASIGHISYLTPDALGGAVSRKPLNLHFNIKKLMNELIDGSLNVGAAMSVRWLAALIALRSIQKILALQDVSLDPNHASVLLELWKLKHPFANYVDAGNVYEQYNKSMRSNNRPELSQKEFGSILSTLDDMRCIRLNGRSNTVTLLEEIRGEF